MVLIGSPTWASLGEKTFTGAEEDSYELAAQTFNEFRSQPGELQDRLNEISSKVVAEGGTFDIEDVTASSFWFLEQSHGGPSTRIELMLPLYAGYKSNSWRFAHVLISIDLNEATNSTTVVIEKFVDVTMN